MNIDTHSVLIFPYKVVLDTYVQSAWRIPLTCLEVRRYDTHADSARESIKL